MIRDVHVQTEYVERKLTEQCIVRNWGERATSLGSRSSQTAHSETSAKQRHCKSGDMRKEAQGTKRHKWAQQYIMVKPMAQLQTYQINTHENDEG